MNEHLTQPTGTPVAPDRPWRLLRSQDGKISGVCAGLATAAGVDLTLVRLAFVAAGLSGFGIIAYIVLALIVPKEAPERGERIVPAPPDTSRWIRLVLAIGAIVGVIGAMSDGPLFFGGPDHDLGMFFGLVLLAVGGVILWNRRGRGPIGGGGGGGGGGTPDHSAPPSTGVPAAPSASPTGSSAISSSFVQPTSTSTPSGWAPPYQGAVVEPSLAQDAPTTVHPHMPAAAAPQIERSTGKRPLAASVVIARVLAWLVVIAAIPTAIALGAVVKVGALSLPVSGLFLGLGVAAIVNLIVWASAARSSVPVLVAIGVVLGLVGVLAGVARWDGGVGERIDSPTTRAEVPAAYEVAIGHQVVDLSGLIVTGDPLALTADVKVGLLQVVVPDDATVEVHATASAGSLRILDEERNGMSSQLDLVDGSNPRSRYVLDLGVGYGRLEVCRASDASESNGSLECVGGR